MIVGAVRETFPGERRVALVPGAIAALIRSGRQVMIEAGAGAEAGFADSAYTEAGASVLPDRSEVLRRVDVLCQVRTIGANPVEGRHDLPMLRAGQTVVGLAEPLTAAGPILELARTGVQSFALELMPRITRAQSMDVLSSQATVSGYKAVLVAAETLPKMFPMMMTAAGTLSPARVFVIGAGVAGLQAIASARRMGAVVTGYDIRPVVREQVESLGAAFLDIGVDANGSEDKGGYAKAMDDAFYQRQQEAMTRAVAESDVVITTAAVPGKKAPVLVTGSMVREMQPGSVIVDLAAERGGNCELTRADEVVVANGVTILGPTNLPATVPQHASQMFSKNVTTFLTHVIKDGHLEIDMDDEIIAQPLLTRDGTVANRRVCELLNIREEPPPVPTPDVAGRIPGEAESG